MENFNIVFAKNLKRIREDRKLSLDKVADLTGVSKSMLGQIERGDSNPTITTVWKIANGLKISFTTLMSDEDTTPITLTKNDIKPIMEDNGRFALEKTNPLIYSHGGYYETGKKLGTFGYSVRKKKKRKKPNGRKK